MVAFLDDTRFCVHKNIVYKYIVYKNIVYKKIGAEFT